MSTHSRIAIIRADGSVDSIYCHSDGYFSHNGKLLLENYNTQEKVEHLMSLGDIRHLQENADPLPAAPPLYDWRHIGPLPSPQKGVIITTYTRDRSGDVRITRHDSLEDYMNDRDYLFESYNYLWLNGAWQTYVTGQWEPLTNDHIKADQ